MKIMKSSIYWIKKQFSKKEYNYENTQIMEAVKETIKKYQWKKGDSFGKVVEVKSSDNKFTYFMDGTQIFNKVLPEFLEEVVDGQLPFPGVEGFNRILKEDLSKFKDSVVRINENKKVEAELAGDESPFEQLISKLSTKNIAPLQVTINLNIPKKDVFEMLVNNADEDKTTLVDTIAKVAVSQIEIHKLQEYLKEEVITFINKYYND